MARVFPVVSRELVRACELPAAALPVAVVRLLPWWKRRRQLEPRGERQKKLVRGWKEVPPVLQPAPATARGLNFSRDRCQPVTLHLPPPPLLPASHYAAPCRVIREGPFGVTRPFSALEPRRKVSRARRTRTCVCAVVRFEVGALRVGFPTTYVVARVGGNSLPWPGAATAFRLGFLRQAVPAGDHERLCGIKRPPSAWRQRILSETRNGNRLLTPTGHKLHLKGL